MRKLLLAAWFALVAFTRAIAADATTTPDGILASCFDVARDGTNRIHLLYGQPGTGGALSLYHRHADARAQGWSASVAIPTAHAPPGSHHRGNDPQLAVAGAHVMAIWTAKGGGPYGSGPIGIAFSADGGATWDPGPVPAVATEGEEKTGYRFPAAVAGPEGFHLIWIHAAGNERSLRHSRLSYGAKRWTTPVTIDPEICACCWNVLKVDANGTLWALYRDDQPRDLALASSRDGGRTWSQHGSVGQFNWKFVGCPHVGGGLGAMTGAAAGGGFLVASVWTGHTTAGAAYALTSRDGGKTWPTRIHLGTDGAEGRHTDTAALGNDRAAAVWDQISPDGATVYLRQTADGGQTWSEPRRLSAAGTKALHPRLVPGDDCFVAFWSEPESAQKSRLKLTVFPGQAVAR